jgi:glycosyltransferase involved in cell wall biosynthesis
MKPGRITPAKKSLPTQNPAPASPAHEAYRQLVRQIREQVKRRVPRRAKVIVASKGDEELMKLNGRKGWHFPQNEAGVYSGYYPADSAQAILWLEQLRARGGGFFLLPGTAFWWLDHYKDFARHLGDNYRQLFRQDGVCAIYDIRKVKPASERGPSTPPPPPAPAPAKPAAEEDLHRRAYQDMLAVATGPEGKEFVPLAAQGFSSTETALKLIAFYLPQFHPIPENDAWWGRGFTEWTNVSKAVPQFAGHYQPHLPGELGFYDLRAPGVMRRQVELARQYGLHGFCFYHYWFAGKRLLEKPLDQFAADPEIDFPFCICWANENWSRRWDGREDEILIGQEHSEESDFAFIRDAEPFLRHRNYIRIHNRPMLVIYRVNLLPNPAATARRWREHCRKAGLGDPYLVAAEVFERIDPRKIGFDAVVEFPPNTPGQRENLAPKLARLNPGYTGGVFRYSDLARWTLERPRPLYELFRTVCPSWDNEPRRPGRGSTFAFSSPTAYRRWLEEAGRRTLAQRDPEKRLVFVNAWNEWGEGAHLEPDRRYGYAYLQATADALRAFPKTGPAAARTSGTILFVSHDANRGGAQLVLLNVIEWFKLHTAMRIKILCLDGGEWLPRFEALGDTILLQDLLARTTARFEPDIRNPLLDFCGETPALIYGNSVASGRIYPALKPLGVPIVTHFHELETSIRRYAASWIGDVLKQTTQFIACSEAVRDNLIKHHRVAGAKISLAHASIKPDAAVHPLTPAERTALRKELGLAAGKHLVFGCGIGMPFRKGADLFIQVARQLARQQQGKFHCYWIGGFDPNERDPKHGVWGDHLKKLTAAESRYITFLGPQDNPRKWLRAADVFLLPSREDPFPLVVLEAAECSVPIICFDKAGGMPRFVDKDAGCVVPFGDVKAMARQAGALLKDKPKRLRLGAQARQKLLARFTVEATSPRIFSACRAAAGRKPAVSVIVPNFNHAAYLAERLESIFSQTFKDFEVILLDDASTDASLAVLEKYAARPDVRLVKNKRNSGSTFKQWLKGIALAQADLVWIAESDDVSDPDFLKTLLPAFQEPRVRLAYANSHVIDGRGAVVGDYTSCDYLTSLSADRWSKAYQATGEEEINAGLGVKNTILSASAVVFRKFELADPARRTLEELRLAGDWYFYVHALAGGSLAYTPQKLNGHRRHEASVVGKLLKQNRVADFFREFALVQGEIFGRYPLREGFEQKWERYLRDQWQGFFPGRPFAELEEFYPFASIRARIAALLRPAGSGSLAPDPK